jgi:hypothetical protein
MPEQLWTRAQGDLCIKVPGQPPEVIVWEHACRVAGLAERICSFPELTGGACDHVAVHAAALYLDAGWVVQCREGAVAPTDLLLRPTPDAYRELSADWLNERAKDILPASSLELAVRAIREANSRDSDLVEAHIVAEADNLDEIGPQAIVLMIRKIRADGRTLNDLLSAWQRQEEYHYWSARISKGLRYKTSRMLAERRLEGFRQFMKQLQATITLQDVGEILHAAPDAHARMQEE